MFVWQLHHHFGSPGAGVGCSFPLLRLLENLTCPYTPILRPSSSPFQSQSVSPLSQSKTKSKYKLHRSAPGWSNCTWTWTIGWLTNCIKIAISAARKVHVRHYVCSAEGIVGGWRTEADSGATLAGWIRGNGHFPSICYVCLFVCLADLSWAELSRSELSWVPVRTKATTISTLRRVLCAPVWARVCYKSSWAWTWGRK